MIGQYVLYKGVPYLVVADREQEGTDQYPGPPLVLLIGKPPSQRKLQVAKNQVEKIRRSSDRAVCRVCHKGGEYLVTRKGNILSLITFRWVWCNAPHNGDRLEILALAGIKV